MATSLTWVIRQKDSAVNPLLPDGVTGKQITSGIQVAWFNDGVDTYSLIFLCGGGRYGCEGITELVYNGVTIDPGDYVFHPGTETLQISPKTFTADATTNVFTCNAHGYTDTQTVRVRASDGALPTGLTQDGKYFIRDATTNTFKLAATSGGTAIDITTAGTGTLRVWRANAGFDDPNQGTPTYFNMVQSTFSGICYVEVKLAGGEDAEPDNSKFKIFMTGRKVMDYDASGNELGAAVYPTSANNALVAVDTALVDMGVNPSRINWTSFANLKAACDVQIYDNEEVDGSSPGTGLNVKFWNYSGSDIPLDSIFDTIPLLSRTDSTVNNAEQTSSPGTGVAGEKFVARWSGKIKPQYSETYTFSFLANDGVRIWIDGQLIIDYWILTSTLTRTGSMALTADTLYDIQIDFFNNLGEWAALFQWQSASQSIQVVPQTRLYPARGATIRYQAHLAATNPKAASQHFQDAIDLAPGWRVTDRGGFIEFLQPQSGIEYLFQFDPNDDAINSTIVQGSLEVRPFNNNRRSMRRWSYRDIDRAYYEKQYVEAVSTDLSTREQLNNGIENDAPPEMGVMTNSLARRVSEYEMVVRNDPTDYFGVTGTRKATVLGKGCFVSVLHYLDNNKLLVNQKAIVTAIGRGGDGSGRLRITCVPVTYPAYTDTVVDGETPERAVTYLILDGTYLSIEGNRLTL